MARAVVLVVDDSRAVRAWLRRQLAGSYDVVEAADGFEALAQAKVTRPDLILLDVDMPRLDGHQALSRLREDIDLADTPVLFLTGRTGTADVVEGLSLGASDYLRKPCAPEELLARVAGALRAKERQDELRRANQLLTQATTTDELTGLGNRRAVLQRLEILSAAQQSGAAPERPVGIVLFDIDLFKRVNDTLGHPVGDQVLAGVAARLRSGLEPHQLVARWGGEEFLVLSPDTTHDDAGQLAERLRVLVAATPLGLPDGSEVPVTVSAGYSSGPCELRDLVKQADRGLYAAKASGRNCCASAPLLGVG